VILFLAVNSKRPVQAKAQFLLLLANAGKPLTEAKGLGESRLLWEVS
jgi:hypothetical protein